MAKVAGTGAVRTQVNPVDGETPPASDKPKVTDAKPVPTRPTSWNPTTSEGQTAAALNRAGFDGSSAFASAAKGVGTYLAQSAKGMLTGTRNLGLAIDNVAIGAANLSLKAAGSSSRIPTFKPIEATSAAEKSWQDAVPVAAVAAITGGMSLLATGEAAIAGAASRLPAATTLLKGMPAPGEVAWSDLTAAEKTGIWSGLKRALDPIFEKMPGKGLSGGFPDMKLMRNADGSFDVTGRVQHIFDEGLNPYSMVERAFAATVRPMAGVSKMKLLGNLEGKLPWGPVKVPL